jgi:hypothetical protein
MIQHFSKTRIYELAEGEDNFEQVKTVSTIQKLDIQLVSRIFMLSTESMFPLDLLVSILNLLVHRCSHLVTIKYFVLDLSDLLDLTQSWTLLEAL